MDPLDPNPELRAEIMLAIEVLTPKLKGLTALVKIVEPGALLDRLTAQLAHAQTKFAALNNVILRLDRTLVSRQALAATGYPAVEALSLPAGLYAELYGYIGAIDIAALIFDQQAPSQITADVAGAVATEQPAPTEPGP
jgi:hypothetical protein